MELNKYQEKAMSTCMDASHNFTYMVLNELGEAGEFSSKIAKAIRKGKAIIDNNQLVYLGLEEENKELEKELMKEAGDQLWQLACKCKIMGWDLETIATMNLEKLSDRKTRNVIDGDGDSR